MNRTWAILLSTVFHPVFINLLSFILVIELTPYLQAGFTPEAKWFYVLYVFITTGMIPLFVVVLRKALGFSKSIMLDHADDRHIPYITTAIAYLMGYYFFIQLGAPHILQGYMLASACIMVSILIINFYTKISAHATSLGALVGLLMALSSYALVDVRIYLVVSFILTGLTCVARLALQAHTHQQIYWGAFIGFMMMWLVM
jgi:hypothetical protein